MMLCISLSLTLFLMCTNVLCVRVPFQEALPLIAGRQVYLVGGYAFIPMRKLMNVIISRVRLYIAANMLCARNAISI